MHKFKKLEQTTKHKAITEQRSKNYFAHHSKIISLAECEFNVLILLKLNLSVERKGSRINFSLTR